MVNLLDNALAPAKSILRFCFHSFYQIKIKHNLVVQIFTAENGLSASRYRPAMEKSSYNLLYACRSTVTESV